MAKLAVIAGTGIADSKTYDNLKSLTVDTPFGPAYCAMGTIAGNQVVFLARHGKGHVVPPHKINFRANMWALKSLGTEKILATAAVGSANPKFTPGTFVVCNQELDFTKNRINTFFNGEHNLVAHVDFTDPYCPVLRAQICNILEKLQVKYSPTGCYVTAEGPRYESAAEVKMYAQLGGDVIGMTGMPETIMAREAEMCYANVSLVTNMAAGLSTTPLAHEEVEEAMAQYKKQMNELLHAFITDKELSKEKCSCHEAVKDFGGFQLAAFKD